MLCYYITIHYYYTFFTKTIYSSCDPEEEGEEVEFAACLQHGVALTLSLT